MKILVTGSTGFLGRHLMRALRDEPKVSHIVGVARGALVSRELSAHGRRCYTTEERPCDLGDEPQVRDLMKDVCPDVVFHLAGHSTIKETDTRLSLANVVMTHSLLEHSPKGCRFVLASSAAVYGNAAGRGDWMPEDGPLQPNSVYGATKVAAEKLVEAYTRLGRVSGVSLRLVANVGAWATHGLVLDLVRKLKSDRPTLELFGDCPGSNKPFVHAGDTAAAMVHFGVHDYGGHIAFNISNHDLLSVHEAAMLAMGTLGIRKPVEWLGEGATWKGDNKVVRVDNRLALKYGWTPKYPTSVEAVRRGVLELETLGA